MLKGDDVAHPVSARPSRCQSWTISLHITRGGAASSQDGGAHGRSPDDFVQLSGAGMSLAQINVNPRASECLAVPGRSSLGDTASTRAVAAAPPIWLPRGDSAPTD